MKKVLAIITMILLIITGCGQETAGQPEKEVPEKKTVDSSQSDEEVTQEDEQKSNEKKTVKTVEVTKKEDQGNYQVAINGDIQLQDRTLTASGITNLLPGSKLYFYLKPLEGTFIGGTATTLVEEDGSFQLKSKLPEKYDDPSVFTEIVFSPGGVTDDEIIQYYTEAGEPLKGPFVRLYEEDEELMKKISVTTEISLAQPETTVSIEEPKWEKPEDYGSPNVWIEATVQEDERYVYINGKSNLLEGSTIFGRLHMDGYITSGFSGRVNTNPDGSFQLIITNPKGKIADLKGYEIQLKFSTTDGNNLDYIKETYGENGEHLQGKLLSNENGENFISYIMKVQN